MSCKTAPKLHIYLYTTAIVFAVIFLDQLTKWYALKKLNGKSIEVIDNLLYFTFVKNTGIAFGFAKGSSLLLSLVGFAAFIGLFALYPSLLKGRFFPVYMGLIAGGALSNFYDRIFRGFVVDFIDFRVWPVFNIADTGITVGMLLIIFLVLKNPSEVAEK
jgi:signal peptidase II